MRKGPWKAHFITRSRSTAPEGEADETRPAACCIDLGIDPSEKYDVAAGHPDVVRELTALAEAHRASFTPPPSQLEIPLREAE